MPQDQDIQSKILQQTKFRNSIKNIKSNKIMMKFHYKINRQVRNNFIVNLQINQISKKK